MPPFPAPNPALTDLPPGIGPGMPVWYFCVEIRKKKEYKIVSTSPGGCGIKNSAPAIFMHATKNRCTIDVLTLSGSFKRIHNVKLENIIPLTAKTFPLWGQVVCL